MADEQPRWKVAAVVLFYMAVALVMVMVNKWVLTTNSLPLTFIFLQLLTSVLLLTLLSFLSPTHPFAFQPPRWTKKTIQNVTPVCTANVVGLVFNIYCLKLVDASYFQVARGLTLPMTVVLTLVASGEKPSIATIASCGLVTWGFTYSFLPVPFHSVDTGAVGILTPVHREAPVLGMVLGVASAAMVAIHAVLVKGALQSIEGKTMDLAYWQNALCAVALVPAIAVSGELGGIYRLISGAEGSLGAFAIGSGVTGVVGFLICIAGLLSIKVTSPVTHMFSAAVRSVLQTMLGVYLFGDAITANRVVSILLIVVGSLVYTYHKSKPRSPALDRKDDMAEKPLLSHGDAEKAAGEQMRRMSTARRG